MARGNLWTRLRAAADRLPPVTSMVEILIRRRIVEPNPDPGGPPIDIGEVFERRTCVRCSVGEEPFL